MSCANTHSTLKKTNANNIVEFALDTLNMAPRQTHTFSEGVPTLRDAISPCLPHPLSRPTNPNPRQEKTTLPGHSRVHGHHSSVSIYFYPYTCSILVCVYVCASYTIQMIQTCVKLQANPKCICSLYREYQGDTRQVLQRLQTNLK